MDIKQYFKKKQPIDSELENGIYYQKISNILFEGANGRYIKILIAHPGNSIWSIGWEVRDGLTKGIISTKDCMANVQTKGNIGKLVYGTLKVIQSRIAGHMTNTLRNLLIDSLKKAERYYDVKGGGKYSKITL